MEFMNRIASGILAVEDGSCDTELLEEEGLPPGKILVYRQGSSPPVMMNMGSIPQDLTIEEDRLMHEFLTISGISDFARFSAVPATVTSGVALQLLTEQDDTRISITAEYIRRASMQIGKHILRLYKQFGGHSRVERVAGEHGDVELLAFNSSELTADDLIFDTENELTDTPANRRNLVFELVRMGMLQDENGKFSGSSKLKVLEMLGFGNWESALELKEAHRRKAERENYGKIRFCDSLSELDDHEIHIREHTRALIQPNIDAKMKKKLVDHIKYHQMGGVKMTDDFEKIEDFEHEVDTKHDDITV
jgi:hypothetical protein